METDRPLSPSFFLQRWMLATVVGWIVGVIVAVLLSGLEGLIHMSGESSIGIGMGGVVGYFQWRIARKWFSASQQWMWASCAGLAVPYVIQDLLQTFVVKGPFYFGGSEQLNFYLLPACGSLLAGLWQQRLLRSHSTRAIWWVLASIAGWLLAALFITIISIPGHPDSALGMIRNIGAIPLGGLMHGLVTGGFLIWLLSKNGDSERLESAAQRD